jgi:hypothetical protein
MTQTTPTIPKSPERSRPHARSATLMIALLLVVTALGTALRLRVLNQPMRYDESFTFLHYASHPLREIITLYNTPNNHVLHTLLVHWSVQCFGDAPWAIRLPALLCGIMLIPASYLMSSALYRPAAVALLTASLVATSSSLIEYSTNARGYSLLALISALQICTAHGLLHRNTRRGWMAIVILGTAGMFVVPTMLLTLGGVYLWLAWAWIRRRIDADRSEFARWWAGSLVLIGLLTAIAYAPIIHHSGRRALTSNRFVESQGMMFSSICGQLIREMPGTWLRDIPLPAKLILVAGVVLACVGYARIGRDFLSPLFPLLLFTVFFVVARRSPGYLRVYLFLLPLLLSLAAAGIVLAIEAARGSSVLHGTVWFAVAALVGALFVVQARSDSVLQSSDTGPMPEARVIADFLHKLPARHW